MKISEILRNRVGDGSSLGDRLSDGQVFAHFVEALLSEAANGQQIVNTFERPVRFAHLQNLLRGGRTDSRHLLKLCGSGGIDVDRPCGRLFLPREGNAGNCQTKEQQRDKASKEGLTPLHSGSIIARGRI